MANTFPLTAPNCVTFAWRNPLVPLIGCILGVCLTIAVWWFLLVTAPAPAVFDGLRWEGRWLVVSYTTPTTNPCLRLGNHTLFRGPVNDPDDYHPLSASLNGAGMTGKAGGTNFHLWFYVPAGLPGDDWYYIYRTYDECAPFGWLHFTKVSTPVRLQLPAG